MKCGLVTGLVVALLACEAQARIERVWLTYRAATPARIVVQWQTDKPGDSVVRYGRRVPYDHTVAVRESVTLHRVEIPLADDTAVYHYSVATGDDQSPDATFKAIRGDELRVAVVGDWQGRPKLDAILKDDVHVLMTAGDNIDSLHRLCGVGVKDSTRPYEALVDAYPELFRSVPIMPVLGNHDREIRPRGPRPPEEPVYDVEATAFRTFFALPDEGWKWRFDVPFIGVRFIALDLSHITDMGTTWQTCHPFDRTSEQFRWYEQLMSGRAEVPPFVVTLYNEQNSNIRNREGGAWHRMISQGAIAITGFGYFAERAEVDGFAYYNTSLSGRGDRYPDPRSRFLRSEDSYILITATRDPRRMVVAAKNLAGAVLDRAEYPPRAQR